MVYGVPLSPGGLTAPRTSSPGRGEAARPRAGSRTTPRARGGFELPACSERSREPISTANPRRAHAAHPSHAAGSPSCQRSPEPPFHVCHRNRQSLELARPSEPTEPTQHQSIFASFTLQVLAANPASTRGLAATAPKTSGQPRASTQHHGSTAPAARAPPAFPPCTPTPAATRLPYSWACREAAGGEKAAHSPAHLRSPSQGSPKASPQTSPCASAARGAASPALPAPHPSTSAGRRAPGPSASCPAAAPRSP